MHSCFFILLLTHVSDFSEKIFNNIIAMSTEELQDMESRVIEAAKRVFVRKGYEATKMGDIALEVGISRTAMHYYFRTKEMLFDAIFGQLMDALLPNIGVIVSEPTSFLEKIPKIVEQYTAMIQANPLFPIFVVNEFNRDPEHLYKTILKDPEKAVIALAKTDAGRNGTGIAEKGSAGLYSFHAVEPDRLSDVGKESAHECFL